LKGRTPNQPQASCNNKNNEQSVAIGNIGSSTRTIHNRHTNVNRQLKTFDSTETYDLNKLIMYGSKYSTWCSGDRFGSSFHISNVDGNDWYYSGTLVSSTLKQTSCDLRSLPYGTYVFRVSGALNNEATGVAYDFCGVHGVSSSQGI
jgi:hypothetical protein